MSPLRWTTKSTRNLADQLTRQGHRISADTVGELLREEGFSLQGNAKTIEGRQHVDRDAQFGCINAQAKQHLAAGDPVVGVDTKKKELVGAYKNGGREWERAGRPVAASTHDFPDKELGKAIPYGIYDLAANTGWVNVVTDHDTAAFAVESIRRWRHGAGHTAHPGARRLLITADAGGVTTRFSGRPTPRTEPPTAWRPAPSRCARERPACGGHGLRPGRGPCRAVHLRREGAGRPTP